MTRSFAAALVLLLSALPAAAQYGNQPQYLPITGGQRMELTPSRKLVDTFNSPTMLDTTRNWSTPTATGSATAVYSQGQEVLSSGTTTGNYALLTSQTAFQVNAPAYLVYRGAINAQVTETASTCKEMGFFIAAVTPTCAAPVTDGVLFEITTGGLLQAVTYASGTRTLIADLSVVGSGTSWATIFNSDGSVLCPGRTTPQAHDTCPHILDIYFNGNSAEFDVDFKAVAFMQSGALGPNNNQLPWSAMTINAGSTVATTLKINQAAVADQSKFTTADPCGYAQKVSSPISITTATTTGLVGFDGNTRIWTCGFAMTIAPSATTADSVQFEYGTGNACTSPIALTGTFGNGDLTTATGPLYINSGSGNGTLFETAAGTALCLLSAGNVVNIQGVITYVQQ